MTSLFDANAVMSPDGSLSVNFVASCRGAHAVMRTRSGFVGPKDAVRNSLSGCDTVDPKGTKESVLSALNHTSHWKSVVVPSHFIEEEIIKMEKEP